MGLQSTSLLKLFDGNLNISILQVTICSSRAGRAGAPIQNQLTEISLNYLRGLNPVVMDYQLIWSDSIVSSSWKPVGLNPPHLITINIDITNLTREKDIFFMNSTFVPLRDCTQFYHIIYVRNPGQFDTVTVTYPMTR